MYWTLLNLYYKYICYKSKISKSQETVSNRLLLLSNDMQQIVRNRLKPFLAITKHASLKIQNNLK